MHLYFCIVKLHIRKIRNENVVSKKIWDFPSEKGLKMQTRYIFVELNISKKYASYAQNDVVKMEEPDKFVRQQSSALDLWCLHYAVCEVLMNPPLQAKNKVATMFAKYFNIRIYASISLEVVFHEVRTVSTKHIYIGFHCIIKHYKRVQMKSL